MINLNDYSIHEDLPESLNRKNTKDLARLADKVLHKYDSQIHKVLIYPVIDQLDSDLVDTLAIQLHCDFYDKSLPLEARRQIVKTSIAWHRIKGTPAAVEMLTQTIFKNSYVKEWFDYGGRPYFFRMVHDISDGREDVNKTTLALLKKAIWTGKNVRSWLEMLEFHVHLEDHVKYFEEPSTISANLAFQEWMPYGHRLWVPERDGSLYRGGAAYRDEEFGRDGSLLHEGMMPGAWPYHHSFDDLSMDEMFAAAYLSFFDDVSANGLFHDGSIMRNGDHTHGGTGTLPADLGFFDLAMRYQFSDKAEPPKDRFSERLDVHFADIIPYGTNIRDASSIDTKGAHNGHSDIKHDDSTVKIHTAIKDDVSVAPISRNGELAYGEFSLPKDAGIHWMTIQHPFADTAEPTDADGRISVIYQICRWGDFRRDGTMERGGYLYDDNVSGSLSLLSMQRGGAYCRNGAIETAADGRLITM